MALKAMLQRARGASAKQKPDDVRAAMAARAEEQLHELSRRVYVLESQTVPAEALRRSEKE